MKFTRIILPIAILGVAGGVCWHLVTTPPQPTTRVDEARVHAVKVATLQPQDYTVVIASRGTVRPRTESTLIPEVAGQVIEISPSLREGGFFEKGEALLSIDSRDYQSAVIIAQSDLARAVTLLEEEKARAAQAAEDWRRLGRDGALPVLVARKPQLEEAQAGVASAQAAVERAERALGRTTIMAPFAGCVLEKMVDVGQVVSPGIKLAQIYAVDYAEVDLPLTNTDLGFLDLPESYRGEKQSPAASGPPVVLTANYGGRHYRWHGSIIRTAGAIDEQSRQLYVTAQVKDPYGRKDKDTPPLKGGLFVEAGITGHALQNVFVVPRSAVRDGSIVLLVDEKNRIRRRPLDFVWGTKDHVVARSGLKAGEMLCLTRLPIAIDGLNVKPTVVAMPLLPPGGRDKEQPPLTHGTAKPPDKSA